MLETFKTISLGLWQQPLFLGAGLGLIHALDADHLSTLSGLAISDRSVSATGYAVRWACGHAATLGGIAFMVIGLRLWSATVLSTYAEILVGILLILIGLRTLCLPPRYRQAENYAVAYPHARGAGLFMGALHGGAGSAVIFALIPLAGYQSGTQILLYLASFSIGVTVGALAFSATFEHLLSRSQSGMGKFGTVLPAAVGIFALVTGGLLLLGTTHAG